MTDGYCGILVWQSGVTLRNSFALSAGNVYPAICCPWGGPMWAPVTKPGHREGWFYDYTGTQFYGMPHDPLFLRHSEITSGGELVFEMR